MRTIERERDYSQALLVFGLPFYLLISAIGALFSARYLIEAPAEWGWLMKTSLLLVLISFVLISGYLAYWLWQVRRFK